jgi:medium-chain acyl-[acyl-carrier-protein] hydrolase
MMMANSWITCLKSNPHALFRLFCFPYAGGAASAFYTWPDGLPREVQVCPVQLPGRESRLEEPPFTRLSPLVQALARAIRPYLDVPFAFFGHSLGALISFELARRLEPTPRHLFVSGRRAPQIPDRASPIHQLPEIEFVEEIRRLNGTPEGVLQSAELRQLFLPLLRADFAVHETYVYAAGVPLDCPITAFGGRQDSSVSREALGAWRAQTRRSFTLHMLPGDHFFPHSSRALLLRTLSQELTRLLNGIAEG